MKRIKVIAEIGINYAYGSSKLKFMENAKKLIKLASVAGCNFVKFQKRTPELAVPDSQKDVSKDVPWREETTTYLQYKKDIEFSIEELDILQDYALENGVGFFTSVWDLKSVEDMLQITDIVKIPSALVTNLDLLRKCKDPFSTKILSTGMSTEEEIEDAVTALEPQVIMHTNSVYPTPVEDLNLGYIQFLRDTYTFEGYPEIGLSSHYYGIADAVSVVSQVSWIEKHITLNHDFWGSDQKASVEPHGLFEMMKKIRDMEKAFGGYGPRSLLPGEEIKRKSLRKV